MLLLRLFVLVLLLLSSSPPFTLSSVVLVFLPSLISLSLGVGGHAKTEHDDGADSQRHARPIQECDSHDIPRCVIPDHSPAAQ
jgi:hypothetical protein